MAEHAQHRPTAIAVRDVVARFGSVTALDGVTFTVDAPATGLLGANGAGKSTLLKTLLGLVTPNEGEVEVLGLSPSERGPELRRMIGYMPEHDCLPGTWTARDFVVHVAELRGLPRRAAAVRASEVLFQVGLEEERSRAIGTFSLGMRQRTKLAQALVHSPELILLDEPTSGLDPAGRLEMLALLRRLSEELGIRVVVSSHLLEDVRRTCDRILVLAGGRLAAEHDVASEAGTGAVTAARGRFAGDMTVLRAALTARGIAHEADPEDPTLLSLSGNALLDGIRDAAVTAGAGIRDLRPVERTLEEVVVEAMS